jgi:N-methylhydantoinase A
MIDVVEVGAGGGSIAWLDDVGALKVGPQSAGADPGPICYRGGGAEPTITDANVVLGRLDPDNFLGGEMKLDADAAWRGIKKKIADPLRMSATAAAQAIVEIAIAKMSLAVREVSVAKGYDPRDFALVASGGAGPLHVTAIARELNIPKVVVPLFPSHFSALGMLLADERHDFIRTFYADLAGVDFAALLKIHHEMVAEGAASLRHAADAQRPISTCAMSDRSSRCRCRCARSSSKRVIVPASGLHSTRSTSIATRTIRRTSRSRWSISGWR